jgi:hypothetical protein
MQYSMDIGPELRNNFDFVFLFAEDAYSSRHKLFEHYGSIFPTFISFEKVFNQLTANYSCMVINNRSRDIDIMNRISWYKADALTEK